MLRFRETPHTFGFLVATIFTVVGCCPRISIVDIGPLPARKAIDCLVVAHRGSVHQGSSSKDNSLPALRKTAAAGVPLLEVDVRLSDEGDLFLFHDGSLNRTNSYAPSTLRGRPIQSLTREERNQVFLDEDRTTQIPLLEQALDEVQGSKSDLQLDLKGESDRLAFEVLERVAKRKMIDRVVIQVRNSDRLTRIRARYPNARLVARCPSIKQFHAALTQNVEFVELERWVSAEAIEQAHAKNTKVSINIAHSRLDEPSTWEYLRSRGVDVLMSDFADQHRCG